MMSSSAEGRQIPLKGLNWSQETTDQDDFAFRALRRVARKRTLAIDSECPRLMTTEMSRDSRGVEIGRITSDVLLDARAKAEDMIEAPMPLAVIHNAVDMNDTSLTTFRTTPALAAVPSISGRTP